MISNQVNGCRNLQHSRFPCAFSTFGVLEIKRGIAHMCGLLVFVKLWNASSEVLEEPCVPAGQLCGLRCTPIYHQHSNESWGMITDDYWTTTCSILSYSTCPDSSASAAAGLATAGFGATSCGSSSSESMSSSPSQNCCKIQCIQNCQFRTPREELVYRIQFPIPKQIKTATLWIYHPDIVRH